MDRTLTGCEIFARIVVSAIVLGVNAIAFIATCIVTIQFLTTAQYNSANVNMVLFAVVVAGVSVCSFMTNILVSIGNDLFKGIGFIK